MKKKQLQLQPERQTQQHVSLPNQRQRKTRIALAIRCASVLVLAAFCFIATGNDAGDEGGRHRHWAPATGVGRRLLAVQTEAPATGAQSTSPSPLTSATATVVAAPEVVTRNCTKAAIHEFPPDGLTRQQRQQGWFMLHIAMACYCFWLLAIVCDDYFVPAMESMCSTLNMAEDVVGATFMAAATSSPELFINCIGTFVTKGDLGVGTVVGSAVFNILAVPACCGLFAGQIVDLDWWPVSRDCLMYGVAVCSLIGVLLDGIVMWYEALALVLGYIFYIVAMYCNDYISCKVRCWVAKVRRRRRSVRPFREVTEIIPLLQEQKEKRANGNSNGSNGTVGTVGDPNGHSIYPTLDTIDELSDTWSTDLADSPWSKSADTSYAAFVARWPITTVLWLTIPDCRRYPRLRMVTFGMCICWIGATSYVVAFLITVVGDTINIPDSVMGLTFLAAGTSVPEAVSSVIVTNQGHGAMGISNSIGSNTFDILLCLGLPWFVKAYFLPAVPNEHWITLNSSGLTYSAVSLLTTLCGLYTAFWLNKFRLDWKIGLTCTLMYIAFLIFASLVELNFFFIVNLPTCSH